MVGFLQRPAAADKTVTLELGRTLEKLSARARERAELEPALTAWIERQDVKVLAQLTTWGLVDSRRAAGAKRLSEHVTDYTAALKAGGVVARNVE